MGLPPATYKAVATIDWDEGQLITEDTFEIGTLDVDIIGYSAVFPQGQINPFNVEIESHWNDPIEDVWAEIIIRDEKIQTPTIILDPWKIKKLTGYWNTQLDAGSYDAEIILHYADKTESRKIKIEVKEQIEEVIEKPMIQISVNTLIIAAIILLVSLNILWLLYLTKKKSDKKKNKKK